MLPRSYLISAGIARYLMNISNQHRLSSRKVAVKMILLTFHTCPSSPGAYPIFLSFYSVLINGLSMPLLMTIFGLLTVRNLQRHRNQIHGNAVVDTFQRRRKPRNDNSSNASYSINY